ncbi:MAG: endolytic transglycosylase MltG [Eubacteriales bacterium]|nr:endolytic transglycosylase MltG [Eubacteriales bacterium]
MADSERNRDPQFPETPDLPEMPVSPDDLDTSDTPEPGDAPIAPESADFRDALIMPETPAVPEETGEPRHGLRKILNRKRLQEQLFAEEEDDFKEEPRDYMPIRTRRDGRLGCLGGLMYAAFIIALSVVLACLAWLAASDVLALNKQDLTATVTLPKSIFTEKEIPVKDDSGKVTDTKLVDSADIDYVARALKDSGLIEYEFLFKFYSKLSDADLKIEPGTYELNTTYDYRALVKKMQIGSDSQVETRLTFPEGFTMEQIFQRLADNEICELEDLYAAAANYNYSYSFLEGTEAGSPQRLEGFLFPDTYDFYQGMQAASAIDKFLMNFHYKLTADMLKQLEKRGLNFSQLLTVASMIEKEAANDDERAIIASVIYNRLEKNMPLCIDATIQYILPERQSYLTTEHTQIDDPYNTYLYTGLPPGPICSPGMASIQAALKPSATSYYYYALDTATLTHRFFRTAEEHNAFVATQNYSSLG